MATNPKCIQLRIDADPRFAAAAGGAVRYLAEASGMPEEMTKEFQEATIRACLEAFEATNTGPHIVELCRFEDRLEVVVDSKAGSNAIRIARPVGSHR